jgi:hypothetical protein
VNEEQWHHHLEKENYKLVNEFSAADFENHIREKSFIKLVKKLSLSHWDNAIQILSNEFVRVTKWLN